MSEGSTMNSIKKIPKAYFIFGIFFVLFTGLMVTVEIKNGRFWTNDFKVYYDATQDYFSGVHPYNKAYGLTSGYFKYPPTTLFLFFVYKVLPYFWAQILHTTILCISFILSVILIHKFILGSFIRRLDKKYFGLLYLGFFFTAIHLVREFHMGNINLILLVLFVAGAVYKQDSDLKMAILWSLMIILKPIVILAFVPLVFFGKWKIVLYLIGFGMLFFILPMIYSGWNGNIVLWKGWLDAILFHGDYVINQTSLSYFASYYLGYTSEWIPSLIALSILLIIFLFDRKGASRSENDLTEWLCVFLAFTPNFFKTDTEHFLLSLPLMLLLVVKIVNLRKKILWLPFIAIFASFSLNSNDLLGKGLSSLVSEIGLLGIANLGLIVFFIVLRKSNKITAQVEQEVS
jgi:hypothetical protein